MFEQPVGKAEKDRSRLIMWSTGAAVIVVIGLIIAFSSSRSPEPLIEMARPGSEEFNSYARFVTITTNDTRTGERLGINYARILCTIRNEGDRTLAGLQLRGVVLADKEVVRDKVISPIPRQRETLSPHQSIDIDLNMEPIPSVITDMFVELHALKLK